MCFDFMRRFKELFINLFYCCFYSRGSSKKQEQASMDYEAPIMPCGCILVIKLEQLWMIVDVS